MTTKFLEQGTDEQTLNRILLERFDPGDKVDLRLTLARPLSDAELEAYGDYLYDQGIDVEYVEQLAGNTVRVVFTRPSRSEFEGVGFLWTLAGILVGGIVLVAGIGVMSWGAVKLFTTVANNILPIALVSAATLLIYTRLKQPAR
jgi:hypothetical protein